VNASDRAVATLRAIVGASLCALLLLHAAHADVNDDQAAITQRLQRWTADFNAKDVAGTCALFAPDLISTVPGSVDVGRDVVCARIAALFVRTDVRFHYGLDIQEIRVSGDMAVVRLVWTLTVQRGAEQRSSREAGMDVFQRQPGGEWSIVRFMAFSTDLDPDKPNAVPVPAPAEGATRRD
jgi:steroid delta-isomerase